MEKINKIFILTVLFFVMAVVAPIVSAATPTLSVASTGAGDSVQVNVTGDANAGVLLFYTSSSYAFLGTTNSSGNFSAVISSATYKITSNASVYAKVGGINGSQSSSVSWPYIQNTTATTSTLTLSQSALLLNAGQTSVVTASASYLYLQNNSNATIANINLNASQITVSANTYGSTTANICVVGSTTNCASLSVVVQNSGAQQLTFSQNNFSIVSGQSVAVTISGGSTPYTVSNNSNTGSIQTSLSGAVITLTATGTSGTASITVCTTGMNYCGIINVSATTVTSTAVTLSQTGPVVPIGQSTTVTIYGGSGANFYVSSNSNPSILQANISNNILTLSGWASGTSNISICAYAGSCASLTAYVSAVSSGGSLVLSQSSISILAGQSTTVTISGGSTPYSLSSNSPNIFNGNISGNILTIYGVNPGSGIANICASIGCTNLSITVNSVTTSANPPTFSQNNILLNAGQQTTVNISGTGSYYISNNTSVTVASVMINGNTATVYASNAGNSNVSICQSGGQCTTLYITVSNPTTQTNTTTTTTTTTTPSVVQPVYVFLRYLGYGDNGEDVLQLQKLLVKEGFLTATPNGHFGSATKLAVQKFQKAHSIKQTGNVGQLTKTALNQILSASASSSTTSSLTKEQQILQIQQAIAQLLAQVKNAQ